MQSRGASPRRCRGPSCASAAPRLVAFARALSAVAAGVGEWRRGNLRSGSFRRRSLSYDEVSLVDRIKPCAPRAALVCRATLTRRPPCSSPIPVKTSKRAHPSSALACASRRGMYCCARALDALPASRLRHLRGHVAACPLATHAHSRCSKRPDVRHLAGVGDGVGGPPRSGGRAGAPPRGCAQPRPRVWCVILPAA